MKKFVGLLSTLCAAVLLVGCAEETPEDAEARTNVPSLVDDTETDTAGISDADDETKETTPPVPAEAIATFGNGCFWCTESVIEKFRGVKSVVSGYSGGEKRNVTYREVCDKANPTGHIEVVQVTYDPSQVSFKTLLRAFFATHDPTSWDKQGNDEGMQYRSVVFYHNDEQKLATETAIKELNASDLYEDPIVTEVRPLKFFVKAEEEHQDFFARNPSQGYCLATIPKKLEKIQKIFGDKGVLKE